MESTEQINEIQILNMYDYAANQSPILFINSTLNNERQSSLLFVLAHWILLITDFKKDFQKINYLRKSIVSIMIVCDMSISTISRKLVHLCSRLSTKFTAKNYKSMNFLMIIINILFIS